MPGYLTAERRDTIVPNATAGLPTVTLVGGDVDRNNVINLVDVVIIGSAVGKCAGMSGYDPAADVNADACVDVYDLALAGANFGRAGPTLWPSGVSRASRDATAAARAVAGSGARVVIVPNATRLAYGHWVVVDIRVENAAGLAGADVELRYDPALLQVVGAHAGGLFSAGSPDQPARFVAREEVEVKAGTKEQAGRFRYTVVALGPPAGEEGVLAYVRFRPVGGGASSLSFAKVALSDTRGNAIGATYSDSAIAIDMSRVFLPKVSRRGG
jgi:hypothetical protein